MGQIGPAELHPTSGATPGSELICCVQGPGCVACGAFSGQSRTLLYVVPTPGPMLYTAPTLASLQYVPHMTPTLTSLGCILIVAL